MNIVQLLHIDTNLFFTQLIGFLILMWLLWKFGFKPLMGIIEQRQSDIKATYDQLDADRDAMVATRREYEQRLAGIEAQAREQIQAAVKEAQVLRDQMLGDAQKQAESILERSRVESQREREKAFTEMRRQVVSLSIAAATKVIGESMDTPRNTKLVDDFIGMVAAGEVSEGSRGVSGNAIGNGRGAGSA